MCVKSITEEGVCMKTVLSIAGSDSSGGAGIQADIKTIESYGLFAETAITAITAQNTCGVRAVQDIDSAVVAAQIDAVFEDIRPDAVKVGMVSSANIIAVIAERLRAHEASNIVLDPVMVATSGSRLIAEQAVAALIEHLVPLATVITPNMPEAQVLCGFPVEDDEAMQRAAQAIAQNTNGAVLIKGGHRSDTADDLLVLPDGSLSWLRAKRIDTENTHGTGCTLSSAIACGLAQGNTIEQAVRRAKGFVRGAMSTGLNLGQGNGPLNHMWCHGKPHLPYAQ